jgi:hypothetical protein
MTCAWRGLLTGRACSTAFGRLGQVPHDRLPDRVPEHCVRRGRPAAVRAVRPLPNYPTPQIVPAGKSVTHRFPIQVFVFLKGAPQLGPMFP